MLNIHKLKLFVKKMVELMTRDIAGSELKEVVSKLIPNSIGVEIEKACRGIYPLQNVNIRKVKVIKKNLNSMLLVLWKCMEKVIVV